MEFFDYYAVCKKCKDEGCCKEPYYAFSSKIEIEKIKTYMSKMKFPKEFKNFITKEKFIHHDKETEVFSIKKINGSCIFLTDNRFCMIQDVKPLDCRQWPLTFDYIENEDKLVIFEGDCPLTNVLKKSWINSTIETIKNELKSWPLEDLAAYSSYDRDDSLKEIRVIKNFLRDK
ncbi:MAG: YkgJ family cysteine cluster protein [Candidatus Helarchaeota archaeon]